MSGGRFNYLQFRFGDIVEQIRHVIATNESTERNEGGDTIGRNYSPEIVALMKEAADTVERAEKMTRVDWLWKAEGV